jgi:hypothetical protein
MVRGAYPRSYDQQVQPADFYPSYIETYVERDLRQLTQISDIGTFQVFLKLCAARTGQMVNYSALGNEAGVDAHTVKRWISLLESSFIVFRLQPYFCNYGKRLVKTPKLYFCDTGLACSLLGIRSVDALQASYLKGALFENMVIAEACKQYYNRGLRPSFYFWRDNNGLEVDLLIDTEGRLYPTEIKAGRTILPAFFKTLDTFSQLSGNPPAQGRVVYGGDGRQLRSNGHVHSWRGWQADC